MNAHSGRREGDARTLRARRLSSQSGTFAVSELTKRAEAPTSVPPRPCGDDLRGVVRRGLLAPKKHLPSYLHYDERGSALFGEVTNLREYYIGRDELSLLNQHSEVIAEAIFGSAEVAPCAIELSAGFALESQVLLHAINERFGLCLYLPVDISIAALAAAEARLAMEEPKAIVQPLIMTNEEALRRVSKLERRKLMMMLGGTLGSYPYDEAVTMLTEMRRAIGHDDAILISTDMMRDNVGGMLAASDDPQGVCAAFNKNVLQRLNREMGASFDPSLFRHVARWNPLAQAVEMHLESIVTQTVTMRGIAISFREGETIHTQSNFKYDMAQVDDMLRKACLRRECTFLTSNDGFALHVLRPAMRAVYGG